MKRLLILGLGLCASAFGVHAQDLIVRCDSVRQQARVLEIRPGEVRYKRWSNPDGPTYVLPAADIAYIRYANGEVERFAAPQSADPQGAIMQRADSPSSAPQGAVPQSAPALPDAVSQSPAAPQPGATDHGAACAAVPQEVPLHPVGAVARHDSPEPVAHGAAGPDGECTYVVGDYYDRDGVRGIVCFVDEGGRSGLVISLDETSLPWCRQRKPEYLTGVDNRADGAANMEALGRFIGREGLTWEDFPAFAWCRAKGDGWYLPSIDEWLQIGFTYNGGTRMRKQRDARNVFNDALAAHGGRKMDRMAYYFSSTEATAKTAYLTHLALDPPYVVELPKHTRWLVRAVHRF